MIYFLQSDIEIIIIRILSQHQDAGRHLNWELSATTLRCVKTVRVTGVYRVRIHVAHPLLPCFLSFWADPVCPGITPFLPKTVNQPSARTMTGLRRDPSGKMRLYVFGFTHNNA